ncbi:hypothetical protein Acr_00g0079080 [Actinidia rufa]|uniref:PGG domain-containing protein n=1 Tax=Actinidia rufa TaxID=165716 RepID=A0A7J0DUA8_9ERIC|nr:hypothetical protein Acr_00g0079080 [Actinidia rufa]
MRTQTMEEAQTILRDAAQVGDINGLYNSIKKVPNILDHIDDIPFVDSPMHIAASAGHANFAIEILSLMPSFGRKLNPDGLSPLHLALQNGHFETVRRVIKFDKELIRVKGRERLTLLHFAAETENKWLLKSKDEIGNTVLHTAVATSQPQMVKLLLKNDLANKNEKNLKGDTALDIATGLQRGVSKTTIKNILRGARASQSSWLAHHRHHDFSIADFLKSREQGLEYFFQLIFRMQRNMSMEIRNIVLVVAVLIATATFQAVLSPPGGVGGGSDNILPNGTLINATMSSTNLIPFSNISHVNATVLLPSDNPFGRILIKNYHGKDIKYGSIFFNFYFLNTIAFLASVTMIIIVLPVQGFIALHISLLFLMLSYGISFNFISPSFIQYAFCVTPSIETHPDATLVVDELNRLFNEDGDPSSGATVHHSDFKIDNGFSLLICEYGFTQVVQLLVDHKALTNINKTNLNGNTTFEIAVKLSDGEANTTNEKNLGARGGSLGDINPLNIVGTVTPTNNLHAANTTRINARLPERREAEQDVILGGLLGAHSLLLCAKGLGKYTDSRERSAEEVYDFDRKALFEFSWHSGFIREHDETSAHGLWTKLKEMYREKTSQNKAIMRRLVLKFQKETIVVEQTSEFQRATGRGQKKRPEKRSQERGHRGTVRFRMADGRSMKVTGIRHVSLRCKIRSDETLKLVEEYSEFPKETGNAAREGRLKGYTDWRGVSRQEELLSDIGPVVLARRMDEENNRCTEARKASAGIPKGCT